jgi:SAM-dependent methyltransferase
MTGRDHYAHIYASQLGAQAKWLAMGAVNKADSVEHLLSGIARPDSILELGAGTGAVIAKLQRRNFARRYVAVDFSGDACRYMERHLRNVTVRQADIVLDPIREDVDVVVVTHVIEHLEDPDRFLEGILKGIRFRWLIVECPLEDLIASRIKNLFRDRRKNAAGHVQFFTARALRALLSRHVDILGERIYAPYVPKQVVDFLARKDSFTVTRQVVSYLTMAAFPRYFGLFWKRIWLANHALLCRPKRKE